MRGHKKRVCNIPKNNSTWPVKDVVIIRISSLHQLFYAPKLPSTLIFSLCEQKAMHS